MKNKLDFSYPIGYTKSMKNSNTFPTFLAMFIPLWFLMAFSTVMLSHTFPLTLPLFLAYTAALFLPTRNR